MVAPMPSNWPEIPWSEDRNSSEVRYCEYGSSSAPIIPLIAPSTSDLRSTEPPAYRSVIAEYVSQNGWKASASPDGVPGVSADCRPSEKPAKNIALPARTATSATAATKMPARLAATADLGAGTPPAAGATALAGFAATSSARASIEGSNGEVGSPVAAGARVATGTSAVGSCDGSGGFRLIGIPGDGRWTEARGVSVHLRRQTGAGTGDPWHRKSISG